MDLNLLLVIPVATTIIGGIVLVIFKRWYAKTCERQDKKDKAIFNAIIDTHCVVQTLSRMNGQSELFKKIFAEEREHAERTIVRPW